MSNISFVLEASEDISFALERKIEAGVNLFQRILQTPEFERWVLGFKWQTNDCQTFKRFYYSCGRSNEEVLSCVKNGIHWEDINYADANVSRRFTIRICSDLMTYNLAQNQYAQICLDGRFIEKTNYTHIHIAAALCQEYCIKLGFPPAGKTLNECWSKFTVPVAMARIIRDVVVIMSRSDDLLLRQCMMMDDFQFDYRPVSFTFGIQQMGNEILNKDNITVRPKGNLCQEKHGINSILTSLPN